MKAKNIFWMAFVAVALSVGATSCGDDDEPVKDPTENVGGNEDEGGSSSSADLDYSAANANSWHNYMKQVAYLLKADATTLYEAWNTSYEGGEAYAQSFKNHTRYYQSARNCVEELLDGCVTIADEVGNAKIGEPYNLYVSGDVTSALYAVESWYSWHSRDDYTNNIWSIRNAYFGSLDGTVNANSLSAVVKGANAELDAEVIAAINKAASAIQAIPQPFRNHINSNEAREAMAACAELVEVMDVNLRSVVTNSELLSEETLDAVVDNYVDAVVLPTYKDLMEKNSTLYNEIVALASNPSNEAFEAACDAWLASREPWEKSEAFLFGPVDALGLDPNMDSWPLDQDAIVQILTSGNFDNLSWSDEDGDEAIEAAQSVRGFHTLEYLLFKDGNPRKVN
ncbi:MAG: peptidase M75 [Bacteroidaceae bacterium]|nr:peptidase M75 [Bacteroidaceae bacterium]